MKGKRCFIAFFCLVFCFLFSGSGLSKEKGCITSFKVTPDVLYQGGIAKIEFRVQRGCLLKRVSFSGKSVPFKARDDGSYMVLVGAGLKERPGKKRVRFYFFRKGKHLKLSRFIVLKAKKYKAEYLKVKKKMVSFPPKILKRVLEDQRAVREACSRIRPVIYWKEGFIWPVKSKILSPFGLRRFFNGKPRSPHSGVDLRARENTPIKSPNDAKVVLVRDCYLSGNTVVLDHGGGLYTLYAHLSKVNVRQGQMVKKGQVIGLSGSTGRVTGPHLHWGVSLLGQRVDPVALMRLLGEKG